MALAMGSNQTRITIYVNGTRVGNNNLLEEIKDSFQIPCDSSGFKMLQILTENAGRVNWSRDLNRKFVGLVSNPQLNTFSDKKWYITSLPLDKVQLYMATSSTAANDQYPMFLQATWKIFNPTDEFRGEI